MLALRRHYPPSEDSMKQTDKLQYAHVDKRLLNVREAAEYLGLQIDTIYRKARLRELPSVKVGRALRFDVVALQRYIVEHTIETID